MRKRVDDGGDVGEDSNVGAKPPGKKTLGAGDAHAAAKVALNHNNINNSDSNLPSKASGLSTGRQRRSPPSVSDPDGALNGQAMTAAVPSLVNVSSTSSRCSGGEGEGGGGGEGLPDVSGLGPGMIGLDSLSTKKVCTASFPLVATCRQTLLSLAWVIYVPPGTRCTSTAAAAAGNKKRCCYGGNIVITTEYA